MRKNRPIPNSRSRKQGKCPSTIHETKKYRHIHTTGYYEPHTLEMLSEATRPKTPTQNHTIRLPLQKVKNREKYGVCFFFFFFGQGAGL